MVKIEEFSAKVVSSRSFELFISIVILLNSFLIGVQTTSNSSGIEFIQKIILYIFTFEIAIRAIAAKTAKKFFGSGWNIFDLSLVLIGWLPVSIAGDNAAALIALRVLRVFRVLRLLRSAKELKLIVSVLIKSMRSMVYNGILFLIFVYLYAVAGVTMFRLPDPAKLQGERLYQYEQLMKNAPNSPENSPDPFENISEALFTLFRASTGEDWTDLRYNLISAYDYGFIAVHPRAVTLYFVSWFCLSAFLLLNLVTGAVINNYQISIEEEERRNGSPN